MDTHFLTSPSSTNRPPGQDVNDRWTVFSVVAGSAVALLVLLTGPVIVGAYVTTLGLSEQLAGLMFSLEMLGFTFGALAMFAALSVNRRHVVIVALAIMVIGNVLSMLSEVTLLLAACRFFTGIGAGILMTMTVLVIGLMRNPDSVYGLWTVGQLVLGATGLIVFPPIIEALGLPAIFAILAILSALLFGTTRFYSPFSPASDQQDAQSSVGASVWLGWICLAGIFIYYAGQAGVWVYLERIGVSWQLQPTLINKVLFVSLFAGIVGSGIAVFLGDRIGRVIPVTASLVLSALSIVLLLAPGASRQFAVAACIFNLAWYLFLPYAAAVIAAVDRNGKLLIGLSVVFPTSLAAGPALAAMFVFEGDFLGPLLIGLISVPVGLVCILPAARRARA
jgi:predicted MFS family arabinose efflux permease